MRPVHVVGVGSPSGDDAVGWVAVGELEKARRAPGIRFHRVWGGEGLLDLVEGHGSLVLIDTAEHSGSPGTVRRLVGPGDHLEVLQPGSTHQVGVAAALALAELAGMLSPRVVVFAVEAGDLSPREGLSPAVAAALPDLLRQVADEWGRDDLP